MDIDEDDDFYADDNSAKTPNATKSEDTAAAAPKPAATSDVEEEEDDDSGEDESDSVRRVPAVNTSQLLRLASIGLGDYHRKKGWHETRGPTTVCIAPPYTG
jgi:hypothetical protein